MNYIYAIKNLINNKMYIGSTKSVKSRKYEHFRLLKIGKHHSPHLQNSYNKHGKEFFVFYILEECTPENRKERELYYILKHRTFEREYGYNVYEPNGDKFKCAESTRLKIKQCKIDSNYSVPIDVYTLDGKLHGSFDSIKECSKILNLNKSCIYRILKGTGRSYKDLTFVKRGEPFKYVSSSKKRDMNKFRK